MIMSMDGWMVVVGVGVGVAHPKVTNESPLFDKGKGRG
jgi:hypothetical protein